MSNRNHWRDEKCILSFSWKTRREKQFGRPSSGWEHNIKMEGVDWIELVQDRVQWRTLVNTDVNLWVL